MAGTPHDQSIPEATVSRLPLYLRSLQELARRGAHDVSSERLAEMAGVNAAKVRKDLSYFGSYGTRGVGYDVEYLLLHIRRELGLTHDWPCVIAGMGNLGQALANYGGFSERGFVIAALVDADRPRSARAHRRCAISHVDDLGELVADGDITIGVIATPGARGPGRRRPDGRRRDHLDPQLRPDGDRRARRHPGPQGRPGRRAADPQLLPGADRAARRRRRPPLGDVTAAPSDRSADLALPGRRSVEAVIQSRPVAPHVESSGAPCRRS